MALEELHCALVLLRASARPESAEVAPPSGFRIYLPGVKTVSAAGELPDHGRVRRVKSARAVPVGERIANRIMQRGSCNDRVDAGVSEVSICVRPMMAQDSLEHEARSFAHASGALVRFVGEHFDALHVELETSERCDRLHGLRHEAAVGVRAAQPESDLAFRYGPVKPVQAGVADVSAG